MTNTVRQVAVSRFDTTENFNYQTELFSLLKLFPNISDTLNFIKALKTNCHIEKQFTLQETINYFKKIKIYGSDKDFYILEYDFHEGATCAFPWKYQIIFDSSGKLLKILSDIRLDIVKIFPTENPFLVGVSSTGHGNGWHEINRIESDTIENVYDGFLENELQTYDVNEDNSVNEPSEFYYKMRDMNNDGYNDVIFFGKIVLIQGMSKQGALYDNEVINGKTIRYSVNNPFKKIRVAFTFLYTRKNGHFIEQEDYSKKYRYLFKGAK